MPRDADFLSPRELLVNDGFVCKLASFRKLRDLCIRNEKLPDSDDELRQQAGFEGLAHNLVRKVAGGLNYEYNNTDAVCSIALNLCSAAPDDYEKIFQDMEALRQDPDNDSRRDKVQNEIKDRKDEIDLLKHQAESWSSKFRAHSLDAEDCETKNLLEGFVMIDDLQDALQGVQKMAGGAGLIADDIAVLLKHVEAHLDPDDDPLDGLVEATLVRKWMNLEKDVNDFLDAYKE
ncbi:hypothetical protein ATEIFO6365_0015003400 [Aspergillus terreus]|uniref:Uncharacterized protein n=1 Tax=Aspergillus terreus TaxID=33178 RepID=A0A5M3ZCX3_ASPTE|nr:hypothetical protein ATETN484_0016003400 [Aspergillus terreus]GFF21463.1 hypothetical protein ATEIFO6365_0015003400 [Aspergillus terreus]